MMKNYSGNIIQLPSAIIFGRACVLFMISGVLVAAEIKKGGLSLDYDARDGRITALASQKSAWKASDFEGGFQIYLQNEPETNGEWIASAQFSSQPPTVDSAAAALSRQSVYTSGTDKIEVATTVQIKDEQTVAWTIKVVNHSSKSVLKVRYPILKNIKFSEDGKNDELLWPLMSTILIKEPARRRSDKAGTTDTDGELFILTAPLHYPRACVNFIDLSGDGRGLTLLGDPSLIMNEYAYSLSGEKGALDLRIDMVNQIAPGGEITYSFLTHLHPGNWRSGADFYRRQFYQKYPDPTYPEWMKKSNGYLAVGWQGPSSPPYGADIEEVINEAWHLGLDHIQMWGQTGNHACPGYPLPDPMRDGEEGMQKMVRMIRQAGFHTGGYFWSCGIGRFEVLSPSYRGVKWEDLPAEVRPPTWDWVVENSHYPTAERKRPVKEPLDSNDWKRTGCKTIEEAAAKKLDPQMLHDMAFVAKPFRDWLYFWVERYVAKYGCDTPYLDVHGCRPKFPEFNPYLKKFGDGTEGQLRYAFLKDLVTNFRAKDTNVVPMIEGAIDAYQVYAAALISGRRRFMEGYRYTFPRHILYEGHGNGGYSKSVEMLSWAYLDGNHFDLLYPWCNLESKRIIWIREAFMPLVSKGRYRGQEGFEISSDRLAGALLDAREELGSALVNIRNIDRQKDQTITLHENLRKSAAGAFVIPLYGEIRKVTNLDQPIPVPDTSVSSILIYKQSPARQLVPFVFPKVVAHGSQYDIQLLNLGPKKTSVKWQITRATDNTAWDDFSQEVEAESVAQTQYVPTPKNTGDRRERLLFNLSSGASDSLALRRTWDPLVEDPGFEREDSAGSALQARSGKRSLEVAPGELKKVQLMLAPNTGYELKLFIFKTGKGNPSAPTVHDSRRKKTIATIKLPSDLPAQTWMEIGTNFTTDEEGAFKLYMGNRGTNTVYFDDISITAVSK